MPHAIRIHAPGGAENLIWEEVPVATPAVGEVLLRQTAIGVNFIDIYHRTGLYPLPYPAGIGLEAAGVVEAVGPGVTEFKPGDRVAYGGGPPGAYAESRVIAAEHLVRVPEGIRDAQAAAMMVKGLTAHYLLKRTFAVQPGDTILVHAAAGGVGLILCQWAKHLGARVIGTAGGAEKCALAKAHGADYAIDYRAEDFVARVREITEGKGVDAVYDSVGKDTFMGSLDCLKPLGMMVSFGQASGKIPPFDIGILAQKGSLFITRPTLNSYMQDMNYHRAAAADMFALVSQGVLEVRIDRTLPLKDAAEAHKLLEGRGTKGAVVLAA